MWTTQQIWWLIFAALGAVASITMALRDGFSSIADALHDVARELHDLNEARRLKEIIERSKRGKESER